VHFFGLWVIASPRTGRIADSAWRTLISYGFSVRHWQMIEAGRPITVITLLRVCEAFEISVRNWWRAWRRISAREELRYYEKSKAKPFGAARLRRG